MDGENSVVRKFIAATPYDIDVYEKTLFDPQEEYPGGLVDCNALTIHILNNWSTPNRVQGHYAAVTGIIAEEDGLKFRCPCILLMAFVDQHCCLC
jgi:hypothetical protein